MLDCIQYALFPVLAGEQNDLLLLCLFPENPERSCQTHIVKTHQGIVQHQGSVRGQFLCHRQTERQIQLVYRTFAAPQRIPLANLICGGCL